MLLNILVTPSEEYISSWLLNGEVATYDNYGDFQTIFELHGEFFENLKPYFLTDAYIFVQAGINPDKTLEEQSFDDLF